ncbi:Oxidoreductase htatip2 [Dispira parvispora]|uniref:Oxidoreductase htatip2 n=1 Tax=Dispira parvispora TaxID=1520584 RepID=A0A9W8B022_9FUNG|nr:Oxidoreductase htatip2 [Dispira parvispora]
MADTPSEQNAPIAKEQVTRFREAYVEAKGSSQPPRALIVGATGEVGQKVLYELLVSEAFDQVTSLGRHNVTYEGPHADKLVQRIIDFEQLEGDAYKEDIEGHTHGFCCLGTTRAKAGKEGFYKVDHDYVVAFARQFYKVNQGDVRPLHFSLVSSMGADASSQFLYTKTKGEAEQALRGIGFTRLAIFQPGMLLCDRKESRWLERAAIQSVRALSKIVSTSRLGIPTGTLGLAIVKDVLSHPVQTGQRPTTQVISNTEAVQVASK